MDLSDFSNLETQQSRNSENVDKKNEICCKEYHKDTGFLITSSKKLSCSRKLVHTFFFHFASLFSSNLSQIGINPGPDPDFPEICPF